MDVSWGDRLELFRFAILAAFLAGLVCPLVGSFLFLRRTSFYGIALPQFASAGVVFGFAVLPWIASSVGWSNETVDAMLADSHSSMNYHLMWAALFTFGGLFALVWTGRRGGSEIGRVAAAFAIATAATYMFGRMSPVGKAFVDELLQGEILGVGRHELETLAAILLPVLALTLLFRRDFTLVSFDREFALVLGKPVIGFETLLNVLIGMTVAVGTMILGPTILFGLLVLPAFAARGFATTMRGYLELSAALGILAVAAGVAISFAGDFPLGASVVAAAAVELVPATLVRKLRRA